MTDTLDETFSAGTDLAPFGRVVSAPANGLTLADIAIENLLATTSASTVLVLRGYGMLGKPELEQYCRAGGDLLTWDFGAILDLNIRENPQNYLFDNGDVPFHWDGAFAKAVPRFFLFQCVDGGPPGAGGETVFCDTTQVYREAPEQLRELWQRTEITYRTDKLAHYGGVLTAALVSTHPISGEPVIRFAEPLDPARYRNPLFLTVEGITPEEAEVVLAELRTRLHDSRYCYTHAWQTGDIVVVDNHTVLHGRNSFTGPPQRHLQRIQIL
ncbi:TauD/TfdA dioxygenase family protein [Nocardia suismassiliense]|uniref:TauD/TfdA dioxygenase family protein n=1 Tax=Nocardia suismassiliense TaxID=2077092 RepID=A0ABW6R149_9NOCA